MAVVAREARTVQRLCAVVTRGGRRILDLVEHADDPVAKVLHELPEFGQLADKYGLTYGSPEWMDDIAARYGLG